MQCDLGHISQMVWHGCEVPNNFKLGSCDDAVRRGEDEILPPRRHYMGRLA
jgi:hypothetical protein